MKSVYSFPRPISSVLALFFCFLLGSVALSTQAAQADDRTKLVLGKVSSNFPKHQAMLQPLAQYLASNLSEFGIRSGEVLLARTNAELIRYLREGKVDLVTDTPFSAMLYAATGVGEPAALKWKKGVPTYYALLFVRKDSPIESLSDLVGHTLAFEDPGSTSAYMLPAAALMQQGFQLSELSSARTQAPDDSIGFIFSGAENTTSRLVYDRVADAGAISNLDWDKPDHVPTRHKREYRVIYRSQPVPRAVEVLRSSMEPALKERIVALLINAHKDPRARKALREYQKTKRFSTLDEATLQQLNEFKRLAPYFHQLD